ncbi:MAG: hypothetical protein ACO1N0_06320 [Fluviicola sp.]
MMTNLKMMLFCRNIGSYEGQLTKRKSYFVEDRNSDNVRIKNDQRKLKWYPEAHFGLEKEPEIRSVTIDDKIENALADLAEVTIEFSNKEKYWTSFSTPDYLKKILESNSYFTGEDFIFVNELREDRIREIILKLDQQDELMRIFKKY